MFKTCKLILQPETILRSFCCAVVTERGDARGQLWRPKSKANLQTVSVLAPSSDAPNSFLFLVVRLVEGNIYWKPEVLRANTLNTSISARRKARGGSDQTVLRFLARPTDLS